MACCRNTQCRPSSNIKEEPPHCHQQLLSSPSSPTLHSLSSLPSLPHTLPMGGSSVTQQQQQQQLLLQSPPQFAHNASHPGASSASFTPLASHMLHPHPPSAAHYPSFIHTSQSPALAAAAVNTTSIHARTIGQSAAAHIAPQRQRAATTQQANPSAELLSRIPAEPPPTPPLSASPPRRVGCMHQQHYCRSRSPKCSEKLKSSVER